MKQTQKHVFIKQCLATSVFRFPLTGSGNHGPVISDDVSKFGDYRNSDGISSEGKSSDYFKKKISVSANSVSIFWALKYIESKLSD